MISTPGRYSKVTRRMWSDERFRALSAAPPNAQTLWVRLLTGPELTNIPGLFAAWPAGMAQSMRWPLEGFSKAFAEVSRQGMAEADWDAGLVWVPKAIHHNRPESPNVVKSWHTAWAEMPECQLKAKAWGSLRAFVEGMGEGFLKAFNEGCPKPSGNPSPNQEQEQEQEQEQKQEQGEFALTRVPSGTSSNGSGRKRATTEHTALIDHFKDHYERVRGCMPDIAAKERVAANRLLAGRTLDEAKGILDRAFATDYVRGTKPCIAFIAGHVNDYLGRSPAKANGVQAGGAFEVKLTTGALDEPEADHG
jgi:hypothetical protein